MLLSALAGALLAWLGYRGRLGEPLARLAAFARFLAVASLLLLLFDPGFISRALGTRPLVLLDRSVSMSAAGGRGVEAAKLAATLGDTVPFGELARGLPGGDSRLADVLNASAASGRPIIVVTDGEIPDTAQIDAALLSGIAVRTLPRHTGPDIALTSVRAPERLATGDTLTVEIEATRTQGAADSAVVEVRDSAAVLLHGTLHFSGSLHARLTLAGPLPKVVKGERWLDVALSGANDSEPGDDLRWLRLIVTPTPGIIVLNATPDWDGRALFQTLKEIANAPVSGYVQLQPGKWHRMSDLHAVTVADVMTAARAADLLAVHGDIAQWRTAGRARLLWEPADAAGDWFVTGSANSPIGAAFLGTDVDSLPPGIAARALEMTPGNSWIGAVARRSRRGNELPVVAGSEDASGRTIWFGLDGMYRWAARGGASAQVWRGLVSATASWLLAGPNTDSTIARPVNAVTQRGRPVRFRWLATTRPTTLAIQMDGPKGHRSDSLRFDGAGEAALALDTGRYQYALERGGHGSFAVEPYSDEYLPAAVTLTERSASTSSSMPRRSWRDVWWLFVLAVASFGAEWLLRRRMGAQ